MVGTFSPFFTSPLPLHTLHRVPSLQVPWPRHDGHFWRRWTVIGSLDAKIQGSTIFLRLPWAIFRRLLHPAACVSYSALTPGRHGMPASNAQPETHARLRRH